MDFDTLNRMIADDAALRRRQMLQPVGGKGDKIFPPTYPGEGRNAPPQHVYERRRLNGSDTWCVLIDSVQSQANRLEECLLDAIHDGTPIPYLTVDFSDAGFEGLAEITSLEAPHRIYDAILRDSLLGGKPFMDSSVGQSLAKAKPEDAAPLLELSPSALLFGAWYSTGQGGGFGAKFARCLTSEIIGVGVPVDEVVVNQRTGEVQPQTSGRRTGSRSDPLGVLRKVEVFKGANGWDTSRERAGENAKKVRPSEINHGNIRPSIQPLGVTCEYAEQTFVLSFAALRRLRFGGSDRDAAGRALLAALGLVAVAEQDARGFALRSRCNLVCNGRAQLELVDPGGKIEPIAIDRAAARALYQAAFDEARRVGFALSATPIQLKPQDKLIEIVRRSRELALRGAGGEEDEAGGNESGAGN